MSKTYDSECLRLAEHFLSDEAGSDKSDADTLAGMIHDVIEDFCNYELPERIAKRGKGTGQ